MRHRVRKHLKFSAKTQSHRNSFLRNLVEHFCIHKSIETTLKRARAIAPIIDRIVHAANEKDIRNGIRYVAPYICSKAASIQLFEHIAPRYVNHASGVTRITKTRLRMGDSATMAKIELV